MGRVQDLIRQVRGCRLCAEDFAQTATAHAPRPVVWIGAGARILIAGQAPGARVHESGRPFTDPSGDRLRAWLGLDAATFYDRRRIAILPMAFCFPGHDARGADLPPPRRCADSWRSGLLAQLRQLELTLLVGRYAQAWHLGTRRSLTATVRDWRAHAPAVFPLPHPSWRNNAWLRDNPWFEAELLPALRARIAEVLKDG